MVRRTWILLNSKLLMKQNVNTNTQYWKHNFCPPFDCLFRGLLPSVAQSSFIVVIVGWISVLKTVLLIFFFVNCAISLNMRVWNTVEILKNVLKIRAFKSLSSEMFPSWEHHACITESHKHIYPYAYLYTVHLCPLFS